MHGLFAADADDISWVSVHPIMRDPRVTVRDGDKSFTRIPKPSAEVQITVVVPVMAIDWTLWEAFFGLNFQRYENWKILFVIGDPDINDQAVSVIKTHRRFLPECDIFTPKRKLSIGEMLNVAVGTVDSDYICLQMPMDHMHPSALASMSEAILKHEADFYHTLRYKLNNHSWATFAEELYSDDDWDGKMFKYRGLYMFRKSAIASVGGFSVGAGLDDPALILIYDLLDVEAKVHAINEYLYVSRMDTSMFDTRWTRGIEWRRDLIKSRWPHREVS